MRGQITSYDEQTATGVIKGDDQSSYVFARHDIHTGAEIKAGQSVDFVPTGSTATHIVILDLAPAQEGASQAGSNAPSGETPTGFDFKTAMLKFDGRMTRQNFWMCYGIVFGASIVASFIPFLGSLIALALIWPHVAISIKRLHDMGKSGWFTLVPYIGATIAFIVMLMGGLGIIMAAALSGQATDAAAIVEAAGVILFGAVIWLVTGVGFLIWIGATDSQPRDNQYGPNPKGL